MTMLMMTTMTAREAQSQNVLCYVTVINGAHCLVSVDNIARASLNVYMWL